jgi:hypothetical protein
MNYFNNYYNKRIDAIQKFVKVKKTDWKFYLENPNEISAELGNVMEKTQPEFYKQLNEIVISEMEKCL